MRPWKTPCALPVTMLRITSVESVCGAAWSSTMVTSVWVSPASRLMPRSVKVGALARRRDADLLAHQLAAGIHDEQRQPGVLAELGIELAEMRRAVGLILHDDPDDLGTVADQQIG